MYIPIITATECILTAQVCALAIYAIDRCSYIIVRNRVRRKLRDAVCRTARFERRLAELENVAPCYFNSLGHRGVALFMDTKKILRDVRHTLSYAERLITRNTISALHDAEKLLLTTNLTPAPGVYFHGAMQPSGNELRKWDFKVENLLQEIGSQVAFAAQRVRALGPNMHLEYRSVMRALERAGIDFPRARAAQVRIPKNLWVQVRYAA